MESESSFALLLRRASHSAGKDVATRLHVTHAACSVQVAIKIATDKHYTARKQRRRKMKHKGTVLT